MPRSAVYTVGHSTNSIGAFIGLLKRHGVTAVADVRSAPYSRYNPQFNRETLAPDLKNAGIGYVFLGKELGARSEDPRVYRNGKVQYDLLAQTDLFRSGLERIKKGAQEYCIALMCAEKDPLDCHRTILVARRLFEQGISVKHILADGRIENHDQLLDRLLNMVGFSAGDLFRPREEAVKAAFEKRGAAIAYTDSVHDAGSSPNI